MVIVVVRHCVHHLPNEPEGTRKEKLGTTVKGVSDGAFLVLLCVWEAGDRDDDVMKRSLFFLSAKRDGGRTQGSRGIEGHGTSLDG